MSESSAPSTLNTTGGVGSRFVSETDLDDAKRRKEEEWKAAYARWVADHEMHAGRSDRAANIWYMCED